MSSPVNAPSDAAVASTPLPLSATAPQQPDQADEEDLPLLEWAARRLLLRPHAPPASSSKTQLQPPTQPPPPSVLANQTWDAKEFFCPVCWKGLLSASPQCVSESWCFQCGCTICGERPAELKQFVRSVVGATMNPLIAKTTAFDESSVTPRAGEVSTSPPSSSLADVSELSLSSVEEGRRKCAVCRSMTHWSCHALADHASAFDVPGRTESGVSFECSAVCRWKARVADNPLLDSDAALIAVTDVARRGGGHDSRLSPNDELLEQRYARHLMYFRLQPALGLYPFHQNWEPDDHGSMHALLSAESQAELLAFLSSPAVPAGSRRSSVAQNKEPANASSSAAPVKSDDQTAEIPVGTRVVFPSQDTVNHELTKTRMSRGRTAAARDLSNVREQWLTCGNAASKPIAVPMHCFERQAAAPSVPSSAATGGAAASGGPTTGRPSWKRERSSTPPPPPEPLASPPAQVP